MSDDTATTAPTLAAPTTTAAATTIPAPVLKPLLLPLVTDASAPVCEGDSCTF